MTYCGNFPFIALMSSGLTSAVHTKSKMKLPMPKPPIMMPLTKPGLFGNHSQPWCIGTVYVSPLEKPNPIAKRQRKLLKFWAIRADISIIVKPIIAPIEINLK